MSEISTKPYLIRAIYEWCADATFTPYLNVKVDENVRVPMEYVKNGEIVLSVSQQATRNLTIGNDLIQFSARFNGVSREISVPIYAVQAIFARENGQGMFFEVEPPPAEGVVSHGTSPTTSVGPTLQAVPRSVTHEPVANGADSGDGDDPKSPPPSPTPPSHPPRGNLRVIK
ncbi:MAG: ClpXP protease specificity-enhancing factor [Burkholderiales bacterium]|jgi:stringent starvation protein B|nr:ClpXP protease specificity-enhancing factor [Nitrosomonadaceae bacterium]